MSTLFQQPGKQMKSETRGSARGLGVVWSELPPRATSRSGTKTAPVRATSTLFDEWDVNNDGTLSVTEICWGLRRQDQGAPQLPPLMLARVVRRLEMLLEVNENPDWHMYDADEFNSLIYLPVSEEEANPSFSEQYGTTDYLEKILPEKSMEKDSAAVAPASTRRRQQSSAVGTKNKLKLKPPLTEEEQLYGKFTKKTSSRLYRFFNQWDVSSDGVLSLQEIKSALERSTSNLLHEIEKKNLTEYLEQIHSSMGQLDWHDIDFDEFQDICVAHSFAK